MNHNRDAKIDDLEVERLVEASQAGDRRAFDELVRLHQRRAMEAAIRVVGSADLAGEAVQDAFIRAYLKINKLRDRRRFGPWLLRIVTNAAISQLRSARRGLKRVPLVDCHEDTKAVSPEQREIARELKHTLQQAMAKLSKKEAMAISLHGMKDLPQKEVAEIMSCSVQAVRWHLFKARKKLKVLLREYLQ